MLGEEIMNAKKYIYAYALLLCCSALYAKTYQNNEPTPLIKSIRLDKNRMIVKANADFADTYLLGDFFLEYDNQDDPDFDLHDLDFSVLTMPFVMTVMPIIWASNQTFTIGSIDKKLYASLEEIRKIFKLFYPSISWSGKLIPKEFKENHLRITDPEQTKTMVSFSGGVDSCYASFKHADKKQHLFIIKAEKYPVKPKALWEESKKAVAEFAHNYGHTFSSARSNWKSFLKNSELKTICPNIPKMWWGYTTQALGYAGIAAPLMVLKGYKELVIGATHTKSFQHPWGSHPLIDNKISFADGTQVIHTGYEATRMDKLHFIHQECINQDLKKPFLRVCHSFGYDSHRNCRMCEKCYRTMLGLLALNANLEEYGFSITEKKAIQRITKFFEHKPTFTNGLTYHWQAIQDLIKQNLEQKTRRLPDTVKFFEWFCSLDLENFNEQSDMPIKKIDWDTLEYVD